MRPVCHTVIREHAPDVRMASCSRMAYCSRTKRAVNPGKRDPQPSALSLPRRPQYPPSELFRLLIQQLFSGDTRLGHVYRIQDLVHLGLCQHAVLKDDVSDGLAAL